MGVYSNLFFVILAISITCTIPGFSASISPPPLKPIVGGWTPIPDVTDPELHMISEWALIEHYKKTGVILVYVRVLRAETQVVGGIKYKIVIRARTGHGRNTYEFVVFDRPWENKRQLISFKSLP